MYAYTTCIFQKSEDLKEFVAPLSTEDYTVVTQGYSSSGFDSLICISTGTIVRTDLAPKEFDRFVYERDFIRTSLLLLVISVEQYSEYFDFVADCPRTDPEHIEIKNILGRFMEKDFAGKYPECDDTKFERLIYRPKSLTDPQDLHLRKYIANKFMNHYEELKKADGDDKIFNLLFSEFSIKTNTKTIKPETVYIIGLDPKEKEKNDPEEIDYENYEEFEEDNDYTF